MQKTIILSLIIIMTFTASAQKSDTIIVNIDNIYIRMDRQYDQFRIGSLITVFGVLTTAATFLVVKDYQPGSVERNTALKIGIPVSLGLFVIGTSIQFDSFKFFNKHWKPKPPRY